MSYDPENFLRTSSVFAVNLFPCFLRVNKKSINCPTNFDERLSLKLSLTNKVKEHSALSKTPQSQEVHFGQNHKNAISHAGTFRNYSQRFYPIQLFHLVMFHLGLVMLCVPCMLRWLQTPHNLRKTKTSDSLRQAKTPLFQLEHNQRNDKYPGLLIPLLSDPASPHPEPFQTTTKLSAGWREWELFLWCFLEPN